MEQPYIEANSTRPNVSWCILHTTCVPCILVYPAHHTRTAYPGVSWCILHTIPTQHPTAYMDPTQ